jgi:5'-phosphate synthase pdxT subunit
MKIGVLALQGDFDAHRRRLEELGAEVVLVKKPEQLDHLDGLVIPGGESSTFLKLLGEDGFEKLKQFVRIKPTFGTCAGAILLANEIANPEQKGLGAIDIGIRRNGVYLIRRMVSLRSKWFLSGHRRSSAWARA